VERQQRGTTTTNNSKGQDAMKENKEKEQKPLDASDLLIEIRLSESLEFPPGQLV
jgi:hypothetical protein